MKCMITRAIISFCIDFDRGLPTFCQRHIRLCDECRDFAAFTGGVEAGLTAVDPASSMRLRSEPSPSAQEIAFFSRALPVAAALALLLILGLLMGTLPGRSGRDQGEQYTTPLAMTDLPEVNVGADLVLGNTAEEMFRRELCAWSDEARVLIASIPLISSVDI